MLSRAFRKINQRLQIICSERTWRKRLMPDWEYKVWLEESLFKDTIVPLYSSITLRHEESHLLVFVSDDNWVSGGICDKLRGVCSVYQISSELHIPFKISWTYPFNLSDYLEPNIIDWRYRGSLCREASCVPLQQMSYSNYQDNCEKEKQKHRLSSLVKSNLNAPEIHIYTNAHFGDICFGEVFSVLFKPSLRLERQLTKCLPSVPFISLSFRFLQLLGDFSDRSGGETLSQNEKDEYILKSLTLIEQFHRDNLSTPILVVSDSISFVKAACYFDFVFTIPGTPKHSDLPADSFDKEFLDFLAISRAQHVYLCRMGKMYKSGFPYYAALAGNKPFEIVEY